MKKSIMIFGIFALFLTSCKTTNVVSDFDQVKQVLETNAWILQDEGGAVKGINDREVSMTFRQENGLQVNGFAGCNTYFGPVDLGPDHIGFGRTASTMMACPDMHTEQSFLSLLREVNRYEISGKELRFYKDKLLLMTFKAK